MVVKASLVLKAMLLEYHNNYEEKYKNNTEGDGTLPSFKNRTFSDQAFKIGSDKRKTNFCKLMEEVWKRDFVSKGFQTEERHPFYDYNTIYIESEKFKTQFFHDDRS